MSCYHTSQIQIKEIISRTNRFQGTHYVSLKEKQEDVLLKCLDHDVIAVLPTGYGKTVIIHMLPYLRDGTACILVVNPLNAILQEQKERFGESGVVVDSTVIQQLGKSSESIEVQKLKSGNVNFILGHPEFLTDSAVKKLLMSQPLASKITHLVIDEAHCIISWGESQFRPAFLKLGSLRAITPSAKVLALTATATLAGRQDISRELHLKNPKEVAVSPDRPNVFLEVKTRPASTADVEESYNTVVDPLLQLKHEGKSFPKTIIYLPLKWCGYVHQHAVHEFLAGHPDHVTNSDASTEEKPFDGLIGQYHAPQSSKMKTLITQAMQDLNGNLRILLATEAYGMGADAPDVRHVVHIGPPSTVETYIQEIGRCGRDGIKSLATLYYNASDIAKNRSHIRDQIRNYCKLKTCRRAYLMNYFGFSRPDVPPQFCCDNCLSDVACRSTDAAVKSSAPQPDKALKSALLSYFRSQNRAMGGFFPEVKTGLSPYLAYILSSDPSKYSNMESLHLHFSNLDERYLQNIEMILKQHLK